jgi:hypothetical protein
MTPWATMLLHLAGEPAPEFPAVPDAAVFRHTCRDDDEIEPAAPMPLQGPKSAAGASQPARVGQRTREARERRLRALREAFVERMRLYADVPPLR